MLLNELPSSCSDQPRQLVVLAELGCSSGSVGAGKEGEDGGEVEVVIPSARKHKRTRRVERVSLAV